MRTRIVSLGIVGVAAAGLLAGCGGEEEPAAAPPAEKAPGSPAAAPEQSAPAAGAVAAEVTKPGTELKVGERAVVPYKNHGGGAVSNTIAITVTAIEPVDRASFAQMLGSKAKAEQNDPYYIRYTVENVGGTDMAQAAVPGLKAVGPGGVSTSTGTLVFLEAPTCERFRLDRTFARAGAKLETCRVQAVDKGTPVTGASYDSSLNGYKNDPIIWTK